VEQVNNPVRDARRQPSERKVVGARQFPADPTDKQADELAEAAE